MLPDLSRVRNEVGAGLEKNRGKWGMGIGLSSACGLRMLGGSACELPDFTRTHQIHYRMDDPY